jgi:hypothetical protein
MAPRARPPRERVCFTGLSRTFPHHYRRSALHVDQKSLRVRDGCIAVAARNNTKETKQHTPIAA